MSRSNNKLIRDVNEVLKIISEHFNSPVDPITVQYNFGAWRCNIYAPVSKNSSSYPTSIDNYFSWQLLEPLIKVCELKNISFKIGQDGNNKTIIQVFI